MGITRGKREKGAGERGEGRGERGRERGEGRGEREKIYFPPYTW